MFWDWLLKYSSFLVTGAVTFVVSYLIWFFTTKRVSLIYYLSHTQFVSLPPISTHPQGVTLGTSTLFLQNQGNAPAKNVQIGHFNAPLPFHNVFPDIPRNIVSLPGGGTALHFPIIPPKTLIMISYLLPPPAVSLEQIISYVMSEDGNAISIPVMLQRILPEWVNRMVALLLLAGLWVAINVAWSLIRFLWVYYH